MRCPLVTAERIEVTEFTQPEYITGIVDALMPDERALGIDEVFLDGNGPPGHTLVRLTENATITRMGMPMEFDEIRIGDHIDAYGVRHGSEDGEYFLAEWIDVRPDDQQSVNVEGTIERMDYDHSTFFISSKAPLEPSLPADVAATVQVSRSTEILHDDQPARFEDLQVGDYAYVEGEMLMTGDGLGGVIEAITVSAYSSYLE